LGSGTIEHAGNIRLTVTAKAKKTAEAGPLQVCGRLGFVEDFIATIIVGLDDP
jgi:hypothetical protein